MKEQFTYDHILPLVQSVEIASDMVQCHFHCPIKSKKIVAITRLTKEHEISVQKNTKLRHWFKCSALFEIKKYFGRYEEIKEVENLEIKKEEAIIHAFGKISERFIWSEEHQQLIYRF